MTLNDIRAELIAETECKIQEMKARTLILPERRADLCELCDMLSQEIYEFAVKTTARIADRNHLRTPVAALLTDLRDDIHALTDGAIDIVVSASSNRDHRSNGNASRSQRKRIAFRFALPVTHYFQLFFNRLAGYAAGASPAA